MAATVGRIVHGGSGASNALHHQASNALGHKATEAVGHEAAKSLGHEAVNALGHEAVNAGAANSAASAGATPPPAQGPSAQAVAVGGTVAAGVVAVIAAVVALSGDDPVPEVAQEPEPVATTAAPVIEPPAAGPGLFVASGSDGLDGNVLTGAELGTNQSPLFVTGVGGSSGQVGQPLTLPSGATITIEADGTFSYEPADAFQSLDVGQTATEQLTFTVSDGAAWSGEWTAEITVEGVNDAPQLDAVDAVSVGEGAMTSIELTALDPDSDSLAFSVEGTAPSFVTIEATGDATAVLTVSPGSGDAGVYEATVVVTDDGPPALTDTIVVTVRVAPAPLVRVTDGLLALYHFEERTGSMAAETSGRGSAVDLTVTDPEAVRWDRGGLVIEAPTVLSSAAAGTKISTAVAESNEVTIEAFVTPANDTQAGPARVVSLSTDISSRNASLGQGDTDGDGGTFWTARLRSTATSTNGLPSLATPAGTATAGERTHVVMTRTTSGTVTLYVDGEVVATGTADGDLSTWDPSYPLLVANEATGERPWLGTVHLVAVYGKALSAAEVDQNLTVGP